MEIRQLFGPDLTPSFIKTLEALSPVGLKPEELGDIFRERMSTRIKTYVAVIAKNVVATASLHVYRGFTHGGKKVGHINDVAVHPRYQRKSIGTAIVKAVIDEAISQGCRKITLECVEYLEEFYGKNGFQKVGIFMRRDL